MSTYLHSLYASFRYRPIVSLIACSSALGTGYYLPIYYTNYTTQLRREGALNNSSFTPFQLIAKHRVSASSSIFVLRPSQPSTNGSAAAKQLAEVWESDSLWSVQAKQPQLQIGREYTPIPPTDILNNHSAPLDEKEHGGDASADIHLLIRKEKNGEMTTYLHRLQVPTASVNLRGPYQDVSIPAHVNEVLFIAGGTGISPALQVAHIMARRPNAKVTILWANRRRDECAQAPISKDSVVSPPWWKRVKKTVVGPEKATLAVSSTEEREGIQHSDEKGLMVQVIQEMQDRAPAGSLRVEYFIDEEDSFIKHTDVRKILSRSEADALSRSNSIPSAATRAIVPGQSISSAATRESTTSLPQPKTGAKLILVSGPNGFVDYWAGKKRVSKDGMEVQGPLGGALGEMELNGWKVWKL